MKRITISEINTNNQEALFDILNASGLNYNYNGKFVFMVVDTACLIDYKSVMGDLVMCTSVRVQSHAE